MIVIWVFSLSLFFVICLFLGQTDHTPRKSTDIGQCDFGGDVWFAIALMLLVPQGFSFRFCCER